jgi:hypothetical protein
MLIKFETPCEALGGCDAFDTDGATREDVILAFVDLARGFDRMKRERAVGLKYAGSGKLALTIIKLLGDSGASRGASLDTLIIVIGALIGTLEQLSPGDVDPVAKRVARKIAEIVHLGFRKEGERAN